MGYEIINAERFFKEKQGQVLKIREMKRAKGETILTPVYELTLEKLIQQINILRKKSKIGTFDLQVKSMKERFLVEVMYFDKNKGFIHINIWTIEK
ncbi:hypothetical protein [Clostridium sardiniense]|uniref:hypothetical protein n=1 Tax=Clostridium sardiniense TaxID=29369 RepID=UPI001956C7C2|nr:hypothetical protein [Clostridium sardiniense]MBM7836332.1 hypothetical protein [Clostridium sardiniense]